MSDFQLIHTSAVPAAFDGDGGQLKSSWRQETLTVCLLLVDMGVFEES